MYCVNIVWFTPLLSPPSPPLLSSPLLSSPLLSSQGGHTSIGKVLQSSAASKLKHLQQNSTDKTKSGKREDFLKTQGQQQVSYLYLALWGQCTLDLAAPVQTGLYGTFQTLSVLVSFVADGTQGHNRSHLLNKGVKKDFHKSKDGNYEKNKKDLAFYYALWIWGKEAMICAGYKSRKIGQNILSWTWSF